MTSQLQTINFLCIGKVMGIKTANGWYYISQAPTERNLLSHASHVMIQMWLVSSGSYPSLIKSTKLCSSTKLKNVHTAEVGHLKEVIIGLMTIGLEPSPFLHHTLRLTPRLPSTHHLLWLLHWGSILLFYNLAANLMWMVSHMTSNGSQQMKCS